MKLLIQESETIKLYIDLIRGGDIGIIGEDIILPSDTIQHGTQYNDPVETRQNLSTYLTPLASRIRKLHCVDKVTQYYPDNPANDGLSNYIRIIFKHPYGISETEIEDYYLYTLRFSDHKHNEAKQDYDIIDSIEVVGKKTT